MHAQTGLHMKALNAPHQTPAMVKRLSAFRSHFLIQFAEPPTENELAVLREAGAKVLSYVPDNGFLVSADDFARLGELPLRWIGRLAAEQKISPQVGLPTVDDFVLVEFHADVTPADARTIANLEHLTIREHPDLLPNHLLVRVRADELLSLAAWDDVSYIFPASWDLVNGVPVRACAGALTAQGAVGQSIPRVGDGWDGPGLGSADLFYYFSHVTSKVATGTAESEIVRAYGEWAKYAQITFQPGSGPRNPRTLNVLFASGAHGDPYPFDGRGGVLAHTFYPYPVNPEPIAGDMHFDDSESWNTGVYLDVFSVALHETGHALGLGHSDLPGAVMYPYYKQVAGLSAEDVGAVLDLYAARVAVPAPGTPATPVVPTPVVPTPVVPPPVTPPVVTPPVVPTPAPPPSPKPTPVPSPVNPGTPPTLTILAPASTNVDTSDSTIVMSGTASDNVGVVSVTWTSSTGFSGAATGTQRWTTPAMPLYVGTNTITIRAANAAGNTAWRTVTVTRN